MTQPFWNYSSSMTGIPLLNEGLDALIFQNEFNLNELLLNELNCGVPERTNGSISSGLASFLFIHN